MLRPRRSHWPCRARIVDRAAPFGIEASEIESTDVRQLRIWGSETISYVRSRCRPFWGVIHTYRLSAHSKGDDTRPQTEVDQYRQRDPLLIQGERLSSEERLQSERLIDGILTEWRESLDRAERVGTVAAKQV